MIADKQLTLQLVRKEGQNYLPLVRIYTSIIQQIFSDYLSKEELEFILEVNIKNELYVVYYNTTPIGITGLYWGDEDDICWFNWFGILPEYRGNQFSKAILLKTFALAKQRFKGIRLYTDDSCEIAVKHLYPKCFDFYEKLDDVIIFSKSFTDNPLKEYKKSAYGIDISRR